MQDFWRDDVTILLVSHSMELICENCQKAIWMEKGRARMIGKAEDVVEQYLASVTLDSENKASIQAVNRVSS